MAARGTNADTQGPGRQAVDVNGDGTWIAARLAAYTLLFAAVALNPADAGKGPLRGGRYLLRIIANNWTGLTATVQTRELDGSWSNVTKADGSALTFNANGTQDLFVMQDSTMRVLLTGAAAADARVYAQLGGIS